MNGRIIAASLFLASLAIPAFADDAKPSPEIARLDEIVRQDLGTCALNAARSQAHIEALQAQVDALAAKKPEDKK